VNPELIQRYLDDALSPEDAPRLLDLLRDDAEFRAEFVRHARMHGLISAALGPDLKLEDVVMLAIPTGPRALDSKVMEKIRASRPRRGLWLSLASIAACLALAVGIFPRTPKPGIVVESAAGRVLRRSSGAPLRPGDTLTPGEGLRTDGPDSAATVAWPDGTRLELDADSRVERIEAHRIFLSRGALSARVAPRDVPLVFETPQGEARVLGTTLRLSSHPKEGTRLEVEEGKVELKNEAGRAVLVETGRFAVAAPGVELVTRKLDPGWTNVTGNVGGDTWGFGGAHAFAVVPGRDEIVAGISERWLWSSRDGGATWARMGAGPKNRPCRILFDPLDPRTFWVSGTYGPGIHKTVDGGASFRRLGTLASVDGLAVDFSDPARRTLLATPHQAERSLRRSTDGGETWERIGDRLPDSAGASSECVILDSNTYLVNSIAPDGLFRSEDAGATWTRIHAARPSGPALVASDGTLFWQGLYGSGLLRSLDRGASWAKLDGPVKTNVVELPDGRLVGAGGMRLYVSSNKGTTWTALGRPIPIEPVDVAYDAVRRSFFVRRMSDAKAFDALFRWDEKP
jgi:hypothetical protein